VVDVEPLLVLTYDLDYPLHGYCHTLLIGGLLGLVWGIAAYPFRHLIGKVMRVLRLAYSATFRKMAVSGVLGAWLHVLFDAPLYRDIKPFYPINANPLYGVLSPQVVYMICALCFGLALAIYLFLAFVRKGQGLKATLPRQ